MIHIYQKPKSNAPIFLLLHGTGGDERDLIPFVQSLNPNAGFLSVRGEVNEHGMNRFFRRLKPGVFDLEDLEKRTANLNAFLDEAARKYQFDKSQLIAFGYSNGANMIASLILYNGSLIKAAVLMHPMVPRRDLDPVDLSGLKVLITAGQHDAMCPVQETEDLEAILTSMNAEVSIEWFSGGHEITPNEVNRIRNYLKAFN